MSDISFRRLVRDFNCDLCYSPMLNAKMMCTNTKYFSTNFVIDKEDRPLVIQVYKFIFKNNFIVGRR